MALVQPPTGLLAYVGWSILSPHGLTWGFARTFPHSQVIGLATIVGFILWREPRKFSWGRESVLMLGLWVLFGLSTMMALRPEVATGKFILVSKLLLIMFLSTMIVNTPDRLYAFVRVIALCLGFYGAKLGLFVLLWGDAAPVFGPEESHLYGENAIGMALAANIPLLTFLSRMEQRRWLRWTTAVMALLSYPAVIGTHSRGAWIALATVSLVVLARSRRPVLWIGLLLVLALVAGQWFADRLVSERVAERFDLLVNYESDGSAQSRFWNWEFCSRVGLTRPLYGGGFDLYSLEAYGNFYPEFLDRWPGKVWSCHSMWMTVLAEHGVIGFLLWVGVLASCLWTLRRVARVAKRDASTAILSDLARALSITLAAFVVAGTFLDIPYFEFLYQVIAMVIILGVLVPAKPAGSSERPQPARTAHPIRLPTHPG